MPNIISFQTCFSGLSISLATTNSIEFTNQIIDNFTFETDKISDNTHEYNIITGTSGEKNNQSSQIDVLLAKILQIAKLDISNIDLMLCANGPGSFTGNRIGLSFCLGIKAAIGKPLQLLPTTIANIAKFFNVKHASCDKIISIVDGLAGEVYYQNFTYNNQIGQIQFASEIFNVEISKIKNFVLRNNADNDYCNRFYNGLNFFTKFFNASRNKNRTLVFCSNDTAALALKKLGFNVVDTSLPTSLNVLQLYLLNSSCSTILQQSDSYICYVRPAIK